MFKKIKEQSLRKHLNRSLEKRDMSQRNSKLNYLGFLVDEGFYGDIEFLRRMGNNLGLHSKDVKVFTFLDVPRKLPSLRIDQVTSKEFNWRGEIRSQNALEFLDYRFDVLIGIYQSPHNFMDLMMARSEAHFKVGFEDANKEIFDLILNIDPRDNKLFKSELEKYLKVLDKI